MKGFAFVILSNMVISAFIFCDSLSQDSAACYWIYKCSGAIPRIISVAAVGVVLMLHEIAKHSSFEGFSVFFATCLVA